MNLPQLPADKANHAAYGAVIFVVALALAALFQLPIAPAPAALGVVAAFAVGKETSDWVINQRWQADGDAARHGVEVLDALATLLGGAVPFVAVYLSRLA